MLHGPRPCCSPRALLMRPNCPMRIPRIILDQNWMRFSCTYYNFLWQRAEAKLGESIVFLLSVGLPKFVFISAPAPSAVHMGMMGWPWQLGTCWCLGGAAFYNFSSPLLIHLWYRTEIVPNGGFIMEGEFKSSLETCAQGNHHAGSGKAVWALKLSFSPEET